jgi:hyperosmotically inducible periplasmic protein
MLAGCKKRLMGVALPICLLGLASMSMASTRNATDLAGSNKQPSSLTEQVRHELVMLPYLGVFDELDFAIEDSNTVILSGQVVHAILKSEAEGAMRRIKGISKVVDNIEVLPLSAFDDSIRLRTYRAIFSRPGFELYADRAVSPIRIIVKNGDITLKGVVGGQMDKTLAEMAARSVSGAFSVTDKLTVTGKASRTEI